MKRTLLILTCAALTILAATPARSGNCPNVTLYTGGFNPSNPIPITVLPFEGGFQLDACHGAGGA